MKSIFVLLGILSLTVSNLEADIIRVAAYNVENYLDQPTETRRSVKSETAKVKIRESIHAINPHVLALEEMGSTNALLELRAALKAEGCDFPYWEHVQGFDTNIHVAILSKLPFTARHPHTNENFLLDGRRFQVSRGFAEVEIKTGANFTFSIIAAHLKSRRPIAAADEAELRLQEAKCLRKIVDARFKDDPSAKLIVLGDFNDTKNAPSTKEVIGHGKFKLTDTRPAERNGDNVPNENPRFEPRNICWTHYYGVEDSFSRIDYLLISPSLEKYWKQEGTYIPTIPNWGVGSDHRPIVATFDTDAK